jgi:hypothetical protein
MELSYYAFFRGSYLDIQMIVTAYSLKLNFPSSVLDLKTLPQYAYSN